MTAVMIKTMVIMVITHKNHLEKYLGIPVSRVFGHRILVYQLAPVDPQTTERWAVMGNYGNNINQCRCDNHERKYCNPTHVQVYFMCYRPLSFIISQP
jgi:hypothetical protein